MAKLLFSVLAGLAIWGGTARAAEAQAAAPQPPPAPTNLTLTAVATNRIVLTWSGTLASGTYRVEQSQDGLTFVEISSTSFSVKTYSDGGLLDDTPYSYRVRSKVGTAYSAYSNTASATTPQTNTWRTLGGNPQHTGKNQKESGVPTLKLAWSTNLSPSNPYGWFFPVSALVVEDGRVVTTVSPNSSPALASSLWSLDLATGAILWTKNLGFVNVGSAAVRHGRVFVPHDSGGGTSGLLDAYEASAGGLLWSVPSGAGLQMPFPAGPADVYQLFSSGGGIGGGSTGTLVAFQAATGLQAFTNATLDTGAPLAAYQDGALTVFTGGKVRQLDAATGATVWTVTVDPVQPSGGNAVPVLGGGLVYVVYQRAAYAINPATQAIAWTQNGYTLLDGAPAYADGLLYVNNSGSILALDAATGTPVWNFTDSFGISFPPVIANNHLFLSTGQDLYVVDLTTRKTVFKELSAVGGTGGWLSVVQGKLLVARQTGVVSAYTLSSGTLPDESVAPAAPVSLAAAAVGTGSAQLTWTLGSTNETRVRIESSTDNGATYTLLTESGHGTTAFLDSGILPLQIMKYRVFALNAAGSSPASNVATFTAAAAGNSWAMHGQNPQHTGYNAKETGKPPATLAWTWASGAAYPNSTLNPVTVEDNRVFVTSTNPPAQATLFALDGASGAVLYSQISNGGGRYNNAPSVVNGRVYYHTSTDTTTRAYCVEAVTGQLLWGVPFFEGPGAGFYSPTVANGTVYIPSGLFGQNWLLSLSQRDGHQQWMIPSGYIPSVLGTALYAHVNNNFLSLDPATGTTTWSTAVQNGSVPSLSSTKAFGTQNRDLYALDLSTHAIVGTVASNNLNNFYLEPSLYNGNLFWISDGSLQVRRQSDLHLLWSFAGDGEIRDWPVIAAGYLYLSSLNNTYILNLSTHALVATIPVGGSVTVAAGKLFIAGLDGNLYAYLLH